MSVAKSIPPILQRRRNQAIYAIVGFMVAVILISVFILSNIGWSKGQRNFWWAMGFKCPKKVVLVNSFFAEAADSRDEAYYFELKPSADSTIFNMLRDKKGLVPLKYDSTISQFFATPTNQPTWFAPEPLRSYEEWISTNYDACHALLDKKTGRIFIVAYKDFYSGFSDRIFLSASRSESRRDVSKIARRFNAGRLCQPVKSRRDG